ncbi:serine/threonine-protein phosphatase [Nocardiopsis gilva YIM 90087]|uniref:Serine/threonine-protein phosphatase n=1 Tax=Nocardiopsis gilva YIM 90087 TaxID=1235441 RepID=A0A223SCM9_9ACTN|nr:PP2C family serine/threonine-protein phosphatase [Nocardiopsis gilva]ASU85862.1 serine/threonine-protein phosphatase [Nocardiopsis gilva YIM 90087]
MTMARTCPVCEERVSHADVYCERCGHRITSPPAAPGTDGAPGAGGSNGDADGTDVHTGPMPTFEPCTWCGAGVTAGYCAECGMCQPGDRDHVEIRAGTVAGVSDRGLRHHRNEDAMAVLTPDGPEPAVVAVVCDGVSTSPHPEQAAHVAAETGAAVLADQLAAGSGAQKATEAALTEAASAVAELAETEESAPACTYVSAVVPARGGGITIGWVGDSRAYWLAGSPAATASTLLTRDDSWSEAMVALKVMTPREARASAYAHALTAWLGADNTACAGHTTTVTPDGPGALVLCSDGLWNYFPDPAALSDLVPDAGEDPLGAAQACVRRALDAGGRDNITVVVIAVPESERADGGGADGSPGAPEAHDTEPNAALGGDQGGGPTGGQVRGSGGNGG